MTISGTPEAGHSCWSYDDYHPFDRFAREFLQAGLVAGERVWYVTGHSSGTTAEWLRSAGAAARVVANAEAYAGHRAIDPEEQVAAYTAVTEQALADGYTGFRVAADVTSMLHTDEQRDAFARYEYVIGRYMKLAPMSAVCAYDRVELGDRAVAELACLHEHSHGAGVTFQLHAGLTPASAMLTGELDMASEGLFLEALRHTDLTPSGGEVTVDATGLHFIDHRSLQTLQRYAEAKQLTAVVRTPLGVAARIADLLDLPDVRVEITR